MEMVWKGRDQGIYHSQHQREGREICSKQTIKKPAYFSVPWPKNAINDDDNDDNDDDDQMVIM